MKTRIDLENLLTKLPRQIQVQFAYNCALAVDPNSIYLPLVAQWLKDPTSVTTQQLEYNRAAAAAAAYATATTTASYATSYAAVAAAAAAYATSYAAAAAAYATSYATSYATYAAYASDLTPCYLKLLDLISFLSPVELLALGVAV
jgi:hypothetical protein